MYAQIESVMDERRKVGLPLMFTLGILVGLLLTWRPCCASVGTAARNSMHLPVSLVPAAPHTTHTIRQF